MSECCFSQCANNKSLCVYVLAFLTNSPSTEVYNVIMAFRMTGSTKVYAKFFRDYGKPKLERCAPVRVDIDGMFRKA